MGRTKTTLVAVAMALVSCSVQATPAATPIGQVLSLRVYTTSETATLLQSLSAVYRQTRPNIAFETDAGSYETMAARVLRERGAYFLSHHLPEDIDSPSTPYWAAPIAQDALALIVHPDNATPAITMSELRRIYSGRITRWNAVGGAERDIVAITPDASAALRREFDAWVLGERRVVPTAEVVPNEAAMVARVAGEPRAIGYVSLSGLTSSVRPLPLDGVLPSADSVYDSSYPLRTTVYIVGSSEPLDDDYPEVRAFIGWVQSHEGQRVVERTNAPLLRP